MVSGRAFQFETPPPAFIAFDSKDEHAPSGDPVPIEYPPRLA